MESLEHANLLPPQPADVCMSSDLMVVSWHRTLAIVVLMLSIAAVCAAQPEPVGPPPAPGSDDWLDIDRLLDTKVTIATVTAKPIREQPGIVSVVSSQQIRETGARDLMDVLRLVPGFYFGQDVVGVIGPSFRGLWAYEGKLKLIVDGLEFNETLFGTTQLGHHIPADTIEHIEIIRGPGSAMYGGTAELAVVRVTTKGADQNGGYGVVTPSFTDGRAAVDYTAGIGYTLEDWRVSANACFMDEYRSNQRYVALNGNGFDMTHDSDIGTRMVNVGLGWRDLDLRFIYDLYQIDDRVAYGLPRPQLEQQSFESLLVSGGYAFHASEGLTITPKFTFRRQEPWRDLAPAGYYDISTERYCSDVTAVAQLSEQANMLAGLEYYHDQATAADGIFYKGRGSVDYEVWSPYAQIDWNTPWANLTLGGRYEHHSAVDGKFVPRLGLTRAWDRFHLKALYSQAYRTPNINLINETLSGTLEPETTTGYELEAGYLFDHGFSAVANLFSMEVRAPLVYTAAFPLLGYYNGHAIRSNGAEFEIRYSHRKVSAYLGYSLYILSDNTISNYRSGDPDIALGIPAQKVNASLTWHLTDRLDWNLHGTAITGQRAFTESSPTAHELPAEFLLDTFVQYRWGHVSLGVGVANLLDEEQRIAQPFDGGSAPIPLKGREVFAKLGVQF